MARIFSIILVSWLVTSGALAQDDEAEIAQARAAFERGVERYAAQDWRGALEAFQEAYRLRPNPVVRVNMANCYERLDRPTEAIFHFERFLAEAGSNASPEQRRDVQAALARLRREVGELALRITPDGAMVRIDGADPRRVGAGEVLRLPAGSHTVEVLLDGYQTEQRTVEVAAGQRAELAMTLRRSVATPPAPPPTETTPPPVETTPPVETAPPPTETAPPPAETAALPPEASALGEPEAGADDLSFDDEQPRTDLGTRLTTPVWIVGGATVAFFVAGTISGVLALAADGDFDDAVADSHAARTDEELDAARARGMDAADRASGLATLTDILLVATLVGAGATAYLFLSGPPREDTERLGGRPGLRLVF